METKQQYNKAVKLQFISLMLSKFKTKPSQASTLLLSAPVILPYLLNYLLKIRKQELLTL
jgi:hypothetical protein